MAFEFQIRPESGYVGMIGLHPNNVENMLRSGHGKAGGTLYCMANALFLVPVYCLWPRTPAGTSVWRCHPAGVHNDPLLPVYYYFDASQCRTRSLSRTILSFAKRR